MAIWTINGDGSPGSVEADGVNGSPPSLTEGGSGTFEFWFVNRGPNDDHVKRFEDARSFTQSAEQYDTYESLESVWYWREQSSPSPLVEIVPPSSLPTSRRIWGLVESAEATTAQPQSRCVLALSILKIANYGTDDGEFDSETAIRSSREKNGP